MSVLCNTVDANLLTATKLRCTYSQQWYSFPNAHQFTCMCVCVCSCVHVCVCFKSPFTVCPLTFWLLSGKMCIHSHARNRSSPSDSHNDGWTLSCFYFYPRVLLHPPPHPNKCTNAERIFVSYSQTRRCVSAQGGDEGGGDCQNPGFSPASFLNEPDLWLRPNAMLRNSSHGVFLL